MEKGKFDAQEVLVKGFINSYKILSNEVSVDVLKGEAISRNEPLFVVHDIGEEPTKDILNAMIEYFVHTEEYEKCAFLSKYMESLE